MEKKEKKGKPLLERVLYAIDGIFDERPVAKRRSKSAERHVEGTDTDVLKSDGGIPIVDKCRKRCRSADPIYESDSKKILKFALEKTVGPKLTQHELQRLERRRRREEKQEALKARVNRIKMRMRILNQHHEERKEEYSYMKRIELTELLDFDFNKDYKEYADEILLKDEGLDSNYAFDEPQNIPVIDGPQYVGVEYVDSQEYSNVTNVGSSNLITVQLECLDDDIVNEYVVDSLDDIDEKKRSNISDDIALFAAVIGKEIVESSEYYIAPDTETAETAEASMLFKEAEGKIADYAGDAKTFDAAEDKKIDSPAKCVEQYGGLCETDGSIESVEYMKTDPVEYLKDVSGDLPDGAGTKKVFDDVDGQKSFDAAGGDAENLEHH